MNRNHFTPSGKLRWIAAAIWFAGVAIGLASLDRAALIPGAASLAPAHWPTQLREGTSPPSSLVLKGRGTEGEGLRAATSTFFSDLSSRRTPLPLSPEDKEEGGRTSPLLFEPGKANLLIFAHPLCPCTRATLHELQALLARTSVAINVRVCFFEPSHPAADWSRGPLWAIAAATPGVQVLSDIDGHLADAFGAKTSGWTLLYDALGRLRFAGGITAARGHEGDNDGVADIVQLLQGDSSAVAHTPVYGCALPKTALATAEESAK